MTHRGRFDPPKCKFCRRSIISPHTLCKLYPEQRVHIILSCGDQKMKTALAKKYGIDLETAILGV